MKSRLPNGGFKACQLCGCLSVLSVFLAFEVNAQQPRPDDPKASSSKCVVVVLEPQSSDDLNVTELSAELTRCAVEGQSWFLERVDAAGLDQSKILTRPEDLAVVASAASIDAFVYFPAVDRDRFVRVLGADGEQRIQRRLDIASVTLSKAHAPLIRDAVVDHIPGPAETQAVAKPAESAPTSRIPIPNRAAENAQPRSEPVQIETSDRLDLDSVDEDVRWLHVYAGFTLTERAFMMTDKTQRAASLRTPLFPGYRAGVVAYPFYDSKDEGKAAGFLVEFAQGFDQVTFVQPASEIDAAVSRLEIEAAFLYRFQSFDTNAYGDGPAVALRAGGHWSRYSVDQSLSTPIDTHQLGLDLGVRVEQGLWVDWLGLEWDMLAHPYVGDVSDVALGSQSWGLGVSTDASINIRVISDFYARLGWGARITRAWYSGIAANNFEDVDVVLFEHSTTVALNYWW